jgi:DeoR/GlpR family transcriptional regulator of sugar metabolism
MFHKQERQRHILRIVREQTLVKLNSLKAHLGVTAMTLWRDIEELSEQGLVKRMRGAVMRAEVSNEPTFDAKLDEARTAKALIARKAADMFFQSGGSYSMEGGTTVTELARIIGGNPATILTNSISVVNELRDLGHHPTVYCSGGMLRPESGTLVGKEAITFFSRCKVDVFFMSASGFDLEAGLTDPNPMEIEVKQAMAYAARQVVLLLDSRKLGQRALMQVLPLEKVSVMVTERSVSAGYAAKLKAAGVKLMLA